MNEKTKHAIELFIAIFGCCLAVFTLFFGDNLFQQITGRSILQSLPSPTSTNTELPLVTSTFTSIPVIDIATQVISTETPTQIPTPSFPTLRASGSAVNCRSGPSTAEELVGALYPEEIARIIGRSSDFEWWYINLPSNQSENCWITANITSAEGDVTNVPVVTTP